MALKEQEESAIVIVMNIFKMLLKISLVLIFIFQLNVLTVFADPISVAPETTEKTVLPGTLKSLDDCKRVMNLVSSYTSEEQRFLFVGLEEGQIEFTDKDVLACGIKTGNIMLWMIPYYIRYLLEFIIGIAGLISVGGVIYGGYFYLFAGVLEDKDKGKKAILYAVSGMVLTLVAWAIVNIVISLVTSA